MKRSAFGNLSGSPRYSLTPREAQPVVAAVRAATLQVRRSIEEYTKAMRRLEVLAVHDEYPSEVKNIAVRGIKTGMSEAERWRDISDDGVLIDASFNHR